MQRLSLRHLVSTAVAALATILGISAIAQAATDTIYKYSTPKMGVFTISPLAMTPYALGIDYTAEATLGQLQVNSGQGCFTTGVNLPQGAEITGLHSVWTSGGTFISTFRLFRHALLTPQVLVVRDGAVIGTGPRRLIKADPASGHEQIVNNNQYTYSLLLCIFDTTDKFHGARVVYTYTNAGD
jgi:hypothetical protein